MTRPRSLPTEMKHLRRLLRLAITPLRAVADLSCSPEFRRDLANDAIRSINAALQPKRRPR